MALFRLLLENHGGGGGGGEATRGALFLLRAVGISELVPHPPELVSMLHNSLRTRDRRIRVKGGDGDDDDDDAELLRLAFSDVDVSMQAFFGMAVRTESQSILSEKSSPWRRRMSGLGSDSFAFLLRVLPEAVVHRLVILRVFERYSHEILDCAFETIEGEHGILASLLRRDLVHCGWLGGASGMTFFFKA